MKGPEITDKKLRMLRQMNKKTRSLWDNPENLKRQKEILDRMNDKICPSQKSGESVEEKNRILREINNKKIHNALSPEKIREIREQANMEEWVEWIFRRCYIILVFVFFEMVGFFDGALGPIWMVLFFMGFIIRDILDKHL